MFILLSIGAAFTVICAAITIYAIATAKEGYEDELGFHALTTPAEAPDSPEARGVGGYERLA